MTDLLIVKAPGADTYPSLWFTWSDRVRDGSSPSDIGFGCNQAHLNRFAARFRVARAFRGVHLDGFGAETVDGYNALFRLFLTWSAFEYFLRAIPCAQSECMSWLNEHVGPDLVAQVRALDTGNRLYHLVVSKAEGKTRAAIDAYLYGREVNVTYLASSLRHLFAHGILTPNANRANPAAVGSICHLLADCLMGAANSDFSARVSKLPS